MSNLLIGAIADDFTGVCDTGAQFASAGLRTIGLVDHEFDLPETPEVLFLNTRSRVMTPRDAGQSAKEAAEKLKSYGPRWVFKKIDTALRGNIAAEVLSIMETQGIGQALFIGAIPRAGRSTVGGRQFLHGIPITESILGRDELNPNPVFTSRIFDLFSDQPGVEVAFIGLDQVRSGKLDLPSFQKGDSKKILIFDAETDEDMDHIVKASMRLDPSAFLYIGASGLASGLARQKSSLLSSAPTGRKSKNDFYREVRVKKTLIVSGSPHPATQSQIAHLKKMNISEVIELDPERLLTYPDQDIEKALQSGKESLEKSGKVAITLTLSRLEREFETRRLPVALAEAIRHLFDSCEVDGLVVLGGETVYALCHALDIKALEIFGEISFVAAYGRPIGPSRKIKTLVTKGGSLGEPDILEKILRFLTNV